MTRDDARSSDAPEGACGEARELVSADLDGELSPDEVARLVAHLSGCAACREHRDRLRRLVRALRGAGSLVAAEPGWAEGLDARLAATEAEERGAAPAAAAPDGEADVAGAGLVVRTASGRVVAQARTAWARWGRWAAAAALILGATGLLLAQVDELRAKLANLARPEVTPQYQPPSSPTPEESPAPTPEASPRPSPSPSAPPSPTPGPGASPTPDDTPVAPPSWEGGGEPILPPTPAPTTSPAPTASPSPAPSPTASPEGDGGTRERGPDPEATPTPREIELAGLRNLLREARDPATPAHQRRNVIGRLGAPRFDHELNHRFLAAVLAGALDDFPTGPDPATGEVVDAEAWRTGAFAALGGLDSAAATRRLLEAPLRAGPAGERDRTHLLAALSGLEAPDAVGLLGEVVRNRRVGEDARYLLLRALQRCARPVVTEDLGAFFASRQEPAWLRREAGAALGRTGDPRAFAPLAEGLADRRFPVRHGAALGLGDLGRRAAATAPDCVAALAGALAAGDLVPWRVVLVRALGATRHGDAVPALIARLDPEVEPRSAVRGGAAEALVRLTGRRFPSAADARAWWEGSGGPAPLAPTAPGGGLELIPLEPEEGDYFRLPAQAGGVVFVVDVSGSMAPGGKWSLAAGELRRALEALPADPRDAVGFEVLFFADAPRPVFGELVSSADRGRVRRALAACAAQTPVPVAQTAIEKALRAALSYDGVDTVYFVSDGADSLAGADYRPLLRRLTRENARRDLPVRIHSVLVRRGGDALALDPAPGDADDPWDIRFMRRLARDNYGAFVRN